MTCLRLINNKSFKRKNRGSKTLKRRKLLHSKKFKIESRKKRRKGRKLMLPKWSRQHIARQSSILISAKMRAFSTISMKST